MLFKRLRFLLTITFVIFGSLLASAQTLTNSVTIDLDFCSQSAKVIMTLVNLPNTARISSIKWYEIDNTGAEIQVATGVIIYTSLFTRKYYVSFINNTDGITYKTANFSTGEELIVNGNFEDGNTGFVTNYEHKEDIRGVNNELNPEGYYAIGSDASKYHNNFFGLARGGAGNYMIVNGSPEGRYATIWTQEIKVKKGTIYYFSAYGMSLNTSAPYANLVFSINGRQIGTNKLLTAASSKNDNNQWSINNRFYGNWTADTDVAVVSIVNIQTALRGNDFGLDDISFGTFSPEPISLDGLNGNADLCEGEPLNITMNVSGGCSNQYTYKWINYTNIENPITVSSTNKLSISNPTIEQHGGNWELIVKDSYTTDTLAFKLDFVLTPEISFSTKCATKNKESGAENNDGAITIKGEPNISYRLLDISGNIIGADWRPLNTKYTNLAPGTYFIEAKQTNRSDICASSMKVVISNEMYTILSSDQICQGENGSISITPSLCCYEWSNRIQKFPNKCTISGQTYYSSSTLFRNSYVENRNTYIKGKEVSYREVGTFRLEEANDKFIIADDGKKGFTYSIYKYPFNPDEPEKNYIVTVKYDKSISETIRAIKRLEVGENYVIIANASTTGTQCYNELMYVNALKMSTSILSDIIWYKDPEGTQQVASGSKVSTNVLFPDGTKTPGIHNFYVSCCTADCNLDKITVTINPISVIYPDRVICSGSSTNIKPIVLDNYGNEIDTKIFDIQYKWTVVSSYGVTNTGFSDSDDFQSDMVQTVTLQEGLSCGEVVYNITARVKGSIYNCASNITKVTVKVVDMSQVSILKTISECVEPIEEATWNGLTEPNSDIKEERSKSKSFKNGDTSLDFDPKIIVEQSCFSKIMHNFEWWIISRRNPGTIMYSGNQQPSKDLTGDNVIELKLTNEEAIEDYSIIYKLDTRCGNSLIYITRPIEIKPRPTIKKINTL